MDDYRLFNQDGTVDDCKRYAIQVVGGEERCPDGSNGHVSSKLRL